MHGVGTSVDRVKGTGLERAVWPPGVGKIVKSSRHLKGVVVLFQA